MGNFMEKGFDVVSTGVENKVFYKGKYKGDGTPHRGSSKSPKSYMIKSKTVLKSSFKSTGSGGGGAIGLVQLLNYGLEVYINTSISDDLKDVHDQTTGARVYSAEAKSWINERSALSLSIYDVNLAIEAGTIIDQKYLNDVSAMSDIVNVVMFGGTGNESSEIVNIGNKIIKEFSRDDARNRLQNKETFEQINNQINQDLNEIMDKWSGNGED